MIERVLPFLRWWPMVNRSTLKADLLAGLTGCILGLPQGVAFAILAGLPPQYGLYAAMLPPALASLFGSSWHMVAGPTNAVAILLFASLSHLATPGSSDYISLVLVVTFLTGLFQFAMGLARLGHAGQLHLAHGHRRLQHRCRDPDRDAAAEVVPRHSDSFGRVVRADLAPDRAPARARQPLGHGRGRVHDRVGAAGEAVPEEGAVHDHRDRRRQPGSARARCPFVGTT